MRSVVRALQLQPVFFEAAFNLAALLQEMGQEDEAIACYRQALHLKPDYAPAWGNLGVALRDARPPDIPQLFHCVGCMAWSRSENGVPGNEFLMSADS